MGNPWGTHGFPHGFPMDWPHRHGVIQAAAAASKDRPDSALKRGLERRAAGQPGQEIFGWENSRGRNATGNDSDLYNMRYIYIYIWSRVPCSYPTQWYASPGSTPFPSICKLLAAFLRSSLVFARCLQHFWLPASYLLGTCYLLDDLRSTHTPSKYLRATYSHIYMCYVSTSYLLPVYSHNTTCV